MSTTNAFEAAAVPFATFVVQELQSIVNNLNPDPAIAVTQLGPAFQVLVGQIGMKFPTLAAAEFGAAKTALNTQLAGVLAKLQSLSAAAPAAT